MYQVVDLPKDDSIQTKTTILRPGDNSGVASMGNTYSPLIPFECLFDTDVGLIVTIKNEYRNGGIFDFNLIDDLCADRRNLIYHLYTRKNFNPLYDLMLKPDMKVADELYAEFKEKLYDKMIENCVYTGILQLCSMFSVAPEIHSAIYYRDQLELDFLNNFKEDLEGVRFVDKTYVNENKNAFKQYYIKYVEDEYAMSLIEFIDHKNIYVLGYRFNFEETEDWMDIKRTPAVLGFGVKRNILNIVDAFDITKLRKE